ncbi:MAG: class II fructose-bisphosphate aldolase [Clostridiales bacterium]|nr:class II fructose-bisphosphate aldolase [Clostridiales bacterium]MDY2835035.1 class II fructose-bisphosphate aldolase [Candidatus Aphodomonas sp.]
MPFVSTREMLKKAQQGKYAVGAFNAENMEMVQAIVAAAEAEHAPVIIQTTPGTLKYADAMIFAGQASRLAAAAKVPVALHLDHGNSFELAEYCVRQGYTSVMIDGSLLPFEDNVALSRRVVEMAGDTPVEAELGTVGGKEDSHEASMSYTDPAQAEEFVRRTGVYSFAPAIGTAHGVYKSTPKIDLERLSEIAARVDAPLVLHGTSGVPDETVRACIERGICKVNYATDLRITFTNAVKAYIAENPNAFDPKKYLGAARAAVTERVRELIRVCGSNEKA